MHTKRSEPMFNFPNAILNLMGFLIFSKCPFQLVGLEGDVRSYGTSMRILGEILGGYKFWLGDFFLERIKKEKKKTILHGFIACKTYFLKEGTMV